MWFIWKIYTWFILRNWNQHLTKCQELYKDETELSPIAMANIISNLPWPVINYLDMDKYHYHKVITASLTVMDLELWLAHCLDVLHRYNNLTSAQIENDRPSDTYIDGIVYDRIEMTEPMSQSLDQWLRVKNTPVNSIYLHGIFDIVHEIARELGKIEDLIDRKYFIRKASPFMDDLYAVIIVLIESGNLHGK